MEQCSPIKSKRRTSTKRKTWGEGDYDGWWEYGVRLGKMWWESSVVSKSQLRTNERTSAFASRAAPLPPPHIEQSTKLSYSIVTAGSVVYLRVYDVSVRIDCTNPNERSKGKQKNRDWHKQHLKAATETLSNNNHQGWMNSMVNHVVDRVGCDLVVLCTFDVGYAHLRPTQKKTKNLLKGRFNSNRILFNSLQLQFQLHSNYSYIIPSTTWVEERHTHAGIFVVVWVS